MSEIHHFAWATDDDYQRTLVDQLIYGHGFATLDGKHIPQWKITKNPGWVAPKTEDGEPDLSTIRHFPLEITDE